MSVLRALVAKKQRHRACRRAGHAFNADSRLESVMQPNS